MKKVLILGGAGFIGFNIIKYLTKVGKYNITIVDNFFRGKLDKELRELISENNIQVVNTDLTKSDSFLKFEKDYDYVYHLAAIVGVDYTKRIPNEIIRVNTLINLNTLEWLKESNCKKVIFASTSENYAGTVDTFDFKVPTPETVPLTINDISNPRFTYAVTKILGEAGIYAYATVSNFDFTIIRYHNVYGPRMGFKHVIPQVTLRFYKGEDPFKIFGYNQTRAFNFVDDAVRGTVLAGESNKANSQIIHIGDMNSEITIEKLVKYIGCLLNYSGDYVCADAHEGSVSRRCPDTTKAKELFGYEPEIPWEDGIAKTVDWYINYFQNKKEIYE